jgi:hypothetical protein
MPTFQSLSVALSLCITQSLSLSLSFLIEREEEVDFFDVLYALEGIAHVRSIVRLCVF